jgi:hypothetical protein
LRNAARYATAVHESSHAVCALSFGLPVDRLSIRTDGLGGICAFLYPGATPEQVISVFFAGVLGERLIAPGTDIEAATTDVRQASKFARGLDLKAIASKTQRRIVNLWLEVTRLAEGLEKSGALDAGEILCAARMPPLAWTRGDS